MNQLTKTALCLAIVTALNGCMVGPNYEKPAHVSENNFIHSAELDQENAKSKKTIADMTQWWRSFNDTLLVQFIEQALDQNLTLKQAIARVNQADAQVASLRSQLLPSGQFNAQATKAHISLDDLTGRVLNSMPGFNRNINLYDLNAGLNWEVDIFGGTRRGVEAAMAEYQASQASVIATQLKITAEVADAYVAIRTLQARIAIAKERASTQGKLVDLIKLQLSRGIVPEFQLRQAEGSLAEVQATIPALENGLEMAMNAFDVLMGDQPGTHRTKLEKRQAIPVAPSIDTATGPAELLRRRPDIIVAERKLAASNAQIGQAISEYYPKISISGLIGTITTKYGVLFSSDANRAVGVVGLRWRLFDFGRVEAEVAAAEGVNEEALAAYRLTVLKAAEEVENAFSTVVKKSNEQRILASGEASLAKSRDATLAGYKSGALSLLEVLDTDERLLRMQDATIRAQSDSVRATIQSFKALGGGWDAQSFS
ncbi:efflux transporter outer membrane subunit [Methylobacter tundripaludum]|uniref:efflux transporter outer membrane subunit n=1 Tax=Methylobacter tundripaludum TaxID=173365 RepID=UPI0004806147|nr:efflux transporter outer membrane subunit [Methylobacter tundripaludum]